MQMFFHAVYQQAQDRANKTVPDLVTYIALRRDSSACQVFFDLIEYALGIELPEDVTEHPVITALRRDANDLISWSNVCNSTIIYWLSLTSYQTGHILL